MISPVLPRALQVRADVLGLRRAGDPRVRHTARAGPRRLAAAALQPVEPRGIRPRPRPAPVPPRASRPAPDLHAHAPLFANVLQPLIDVFDAVILFFHDTSGSSWGLSIIALTVVVRARPAAADAQAVQVDAVASARSRREIKKLQEKYKDDKQRLQPGDDEVLPGEQGQPVRPPACRCCCSCRSSSRCSTCCARTCSSTSAADGSSATGHRRATATLADALRHGRPRSAKFLFIPDLTAPATGGVLVVLIVLYVGSQLASSLLMTRDGGQEPAAA